MCLVLSVLGLLSDLISPNGPHGIDHAVLVASSHFINEDKMKSGKIMEVPKATHVLNGRSGFKPVCWGPNFCSESIFCITH